MASATDLVLTNLLVRSKPVHMLWQSIFSWVLRHPWPYPPAGDTVGTTQDRTSLPAHLFTSIPGPPPVPAFPLSQRISKLTLDPDKYMLWNWLSAPWSQQLLLGEESKSLCLKHSYCLREENIYSNSGCPAVLTLCLHLERLARMIFLSISFLICKTQKMVLTYL